MPERRRRRAAEQGAGLPRREPAPGPWRMRWDQAWWRFLWGSPDIARRAFYAFTLTDWPAVVDYLNDWQGPVSALSSYVSVWRRDREAPVRRQRVREEAEWYDLSDSYRRRLAGWARKHVVERDRWGDSFSTPQKPRRHWEPGPGQTWLDDPLYARWYSRADLRAARGRSTSPRPGEVVPVEQHGTVNQWGYVVLVAREETRARRNQRRRQR